MAERIEALAHSLMIGPSFDVVELYDNDNDRERQFIVVASDSDLPEHTDNAPEVLIRLCRQYNDGLIRRRQFLTDMRRIGYDLGMRLPRNNEVRRWHRRRGGEWQTG